MKNLKSTFIFIIVVMFSFSVYSQWVKLPGPEGGHVQTIQKVGNQVWAGGPGGLFTSADQGLTWHHSGLIKGWVSVIETSNDSTIIFYDIDSVVSMFPYSFSYCISSIDGGISWSTPVLIALASFGWGAELYRSNSVCIVRCGDYYISHDYGHSWSSFSPPFGSYIDHLFSDGKTLLIRSMDASNPPVFKSYISRNSAASWQIINYPEIINSFFIKDQLLFMSVKDTSTTPDHYFIVRSPNYGTSWDTVYTGQTGEMLLDIISRDSSIYVYNSHDYSFDSLLVSLDNGSTWTICGWPGNFYSNFITYPNGERIAIGDNGVVRCLPGSNTILPSNSGLAAHKTEYLGSNKNVLFASTDMGLYRSTDAGQTWQHVSLQDSPASSMTFKGDTIFCIAGSHLGKSYDNGLTWDTITPPSRLISLYSEETSIEINNNVLYFSADTMFYSNDYGQNWQNLPYLPAVPGNPCYTNHETTGSFTSFENELYAVTADGFIYKYNTSTVSWQYLTCFWSTGAHTNNHLFIVDSALFVCGSGFKYTLDHGQTWTTPACHGLSYYPDCIISINGAWFCSSYYEGVSISMDQGTNWQHMQSGRIPFTPYGGLTAMNGCLFAGSFGSSIWRRSGSVESISGIIYLDANNNGINEVSEVRLPNIIVKTNPFPMAVSTDSSGFYNLLTDMTGDTLSPMKPYPYVSINPPYYINNGAAANRDFGIYLPPGIRELSLDITPVSVFQPGFQNLLQVTVNNNGSVKQPGQVQITLDSNVTFISANPSPVSVTGNLYTWLTDSLAFQETSNISILVSTNLNVLLGDSIRCNAIVYPILHDTLPANNYSRIGDIVVGSYDPNDKQCQQGDFITPQQIQNGEEIIYTIRFQNTGTYQATFIHVIDTLSNYFDLSTLRIISSSHTMTWTLAQGNAVDFYFQNILLPPSSVDEPNSHGFVKFGVKCKKSMALGNALTNTAYIYFDFNPAIVTNTTATVVINPITVVIPEDFTNNTSGNIMVFPNPTSNTLYIDLGSFEDKGLHLFIYNLSGKVVKEENISGRLPSIHMDENADGLYIGIILNPSNGKQVSFKFMLKK